jgi:hypothetical protein
MPNGEKDEPENMIWRWDARVRRFLAESKTKQSDLYDGVLELARAWKIEFSPIEVRKSRKGTHPV